jgi:actin related protein 2/3 complex, subunit 2
MILLNSDSSIISETLKLNQNSPVTRLDKVDISFEDHSGGHFHLYASKNNAGHKEIKLSAKLPAWKEISKEKDLMEIIETEFEGIYCKSGDEGFDVTISSEIDELSNEKIEKFAQLKQKIVSSPIARIFKYFKEGGAKNLEPFTVSFENKDFYSVVPGANKDQIIVLFGMNFVDQTDTILAKVFLQEFYDTRNNRMEDAPVVLYGKEPPKELSNLSKSSDNSSLNYLTLVLFPRHYATPQAQDHLLKTVPFLSDYIHYHLKCSKAYLHQRMRAKTGDFLKVLNRAKPENFNK